MIHKSVVLACCPERAFVLFTEQAGLWWPGDRRHTRDPASEIRMAASGRFFERGSDGAEVELGVVRRFEPPHLVLLDWYPGTSRATPTRVTITFEAAGEGTRVTVHHAVGGAGAELFERTAAAYDRSWDLVLTALAALDLS